MNSNDNWIPPCDLCGSYRYEHIDVDERTSVRRCLECGLVAVASPVPKDLRRIPSTGVPEAILISTLRSATRGGLRRFLLIGTATQLLCESADETGASITTLSEILGGHHQQHIPISPSTLAGLNLPPEEFDAILVAQGLESFASPAILFEKSRMWLRPDGILLVGAWNFNALPALLRRKTWLRRHASGAYHLLSLPLIRRYSERYGFRVSSVRTRSHTQEVAALVTGSLKPSWLMEMASVPLALASGLLGMGALAVVQMSKGRMLVRPIVLDTEAEDAPGLAPAMYVGRLNSSEP